MFQEEKPVALIRAWLFADDSEESVTARKILERSGISFTLVTLCKVSEPEFAIGSASYKGLQKIKEFVEQHTERSL